jgi:hypothetical protein
LSVYEPSALLKKFPISKIEDVFLMPQEVHTVGRLKKEIGEDKVKAYIEIMVVDFLNFVNLVRSMNESQIKQTAELICEDFTALKMPEVAFVFKLAKKGNFGAIYEGIDGMKIYGFFKKYFDDRLNEAEMMSEREHKKAKQELKDVKIPVEVIKKAYELMTSTEYVPEKVERVKSDRVKDDEEYQKFKQEYYLKNIKNNG